ncbi:hypothetical protein QUB47_13465 [Microcoleus sp. AT9_B5]
MSILEAREYLKAGQLETAMQLAETSADKEGKDLFLVDIAYNYAMARQSDRALQIVEKIDNHRKNDLFIAVVENYVEAEEFEQAKQIAETIKNPDGDDYKVHALSEIAYGYAKAGQFELAVEFAESLDCDFHKNEALWEIAYRYAEIGQFELALQMANPSISSGDDSLGAIAEMMVAQELECDQIIRIIQTIENEYDEKSMLNSMVYHYANTANSFDKLLKFARSVTDESIKYEALKHLAQSFLEAKEYDLVVQIAKSIGLERVRVTSGRLIIPPDSSS